MATGRDTVDSVGLGELHLDTRSGNATTGEQRSVSEDPWAQLSEQLAWEQRCLPVDPPKAPPLSLAQAGLLDDLPPHSFALTTSELATAAAEFPPSPALAEAEAAPELPASPREPRSAPEDESAAAPLAPSPALSADGQDNAPRRQSPAADELPTGPSLLDKSAAAPRVRWRVKAQERGLRSAFVAAADDFSALAPEPHAVGSPGPRPAAESPPFPGNGQDTTLAAAAALLSSDASLTPTPQPVEASSRSAASAAPAAMSPVLATAPSDASPRSGDPQGEPGRMFRALQRPRLAAPPPKSQPPSPPPAPPLAGSALATVKQSIKRGKQLVQQLLRPRETNATGTRPEARRTADAAAPPGSNDQKG